MIWLLPNKELSAQFPDSFYSFFFFFLSAKDMSWLIGKHSDAGRDWGQEEKGKTEDEMAGWHHRLDGHESEWTLGDVDEHGGLSCCDSWGRNKSDMTEQLNWTELNWTEGYGKVPEGLQIESLCVLYRENKGNEKSKGTTHSQYWMTFLSQSVRTIRRFKI